MFEFQLILDPTQGRSTWWHDVTENLSYPASGLPSPLIEIRTSVLANCPGAFKLRETRTPENKQYMEAFIQDYSEPEYQSVYPHAVMGLHFLNCPMPEGLSFQFRKPDEDYEGLLGMRMIFRGIDTTLWFSPEHNYFPVYSKRILGMKKEVIITYRVSELATQEHRGTVVHYPKTYESEIVRLDPAPKPGWQSLYSVNVLSIDFHEFDPEFHPTVTFPPGTHIEDQRSQTPFEREIGSYLKPIIGNPRSYVTTRSETYPQGAQHSLVAISMAFLCGVAAIAIIVWLFFRRRGSGSDDL
ncbi:MAG: hypothetical protein ABIH23_10400 [bacterium]